MKLPDGLQSYPCLTTARHVFKASMKVVAASRHRLSSQSAFSDHLQVPKNLQPFPVSYCSGAHLQSQQEVIVTVVTEVVSASRMEAKMANCR